MCVYPRVEPEKLVATTGVIRQTDCAGPFVPVRRERNAKATACVVYPNPNRVTARVVRQHRFVPTTDVRVPKAPPSTTKGSVSVLPGPYWWITNVNPSYAPVRGPATPAPTSMAIAVAPGAMKTVVRADTDTVKIIVRATQYTDICRMFHISDAFTAI